MTNYGGKSRLLAHDNDARAREAAIRADERARIVRFLASEAQRPYTDDMRAVIRALAERIGDGAHTLELRSTFDDTAKAGEEG
jgi:hypothetical protein